MIIRPIIYAYASTIWLDMSKRMLCKDTVLAMLTEVILRKLSFMNSFNVVFPKKKNNMIKGEGKNYLHFGSSRPK